MSHRLECLFRPRSVAVVGGSRDPLSMSGTVYRNLTGSFRGPVLLVNPQASADGFPNAYESILEIADPVDLAIVAVPARVALHVVRQCVAKRVGAIVMITAGFAELGDAEQDTSSELLELVRSSGVPLVGPNCLGIVATARDWPVNASFGPFTQPVGSIAVATQSGALGFAVTEYLRLRNLGLTELVSLGNKLDLNESDFLEYWHDASTARVVAAYLESIHEPRRFLEIARRMSAQRPIVLVKSGGTAAGRRAAGSHTAALASPERLTDAVVRQAGVIRVPTLEELCETITLLARQPVPRGRRAAILTNAGGPGVMTTDALAARDWQIPEFSPALQARLRSLTTPLMSVRNPVDLIGTVDAALYGHCLELIRSSGEVDVVLPVYVPRLPGTSEAIVRVIAQNAAQATHPPVLAAVLMESESELARLQVLCEPVPCYQFPDSAVRALTRAVEYGEWLARCAEPAVPSLAIDTAAVRSLVDAALARLPDVGGWLTPAEVQGIVATCGIAAPPWRLARTTDEALRAAEELSYPLVVKAVARDLIHKKAAGAVALDLRNAGDLTAACDAFAHRFAALDGLLLQEFRPGDEELLVGVNWENHFGHVIALGRGGTAVEREARVAFRLLPLSMVEARDLVRQPLPQFAGSSLETPIVEVLLRVAALVATAPEIRELDFNPVAVDLRGAELRALDARIYLRGTNNVDGGQPESK